ncbi:cryptochrome/photolyase family protein [Pseudomonas sp.]|uniref:cryptochrome/photolyase family protein n=1 Tax=Pseudomonas sp. TaxID=306 RepID=UPI003FD83B6C
MFGHLDTENRKKLPRGLSGPFHASFAADDITCEVLAVVGDPLQGSLWSLDRFDYPVTHAEAQELWRHFLDSPKHRLA